jgi:excisionase family DNA binding protein
MTFVSDGLTPSAWGLDIFAMNETASAVPSFLDGRALVRINDTCKILGVGRSKVYDMITDGRLAVRKIDGRTLITAESITRLLDQLPSGVEPERYAGARKTSA